MFVKNESHAYEKRGYRIILWNDTKIKDEHIN